MLIIAEFDIEWPALETRRVVGAFLVFIIWGKMFDWMRLFDRTSFYIKLVIETVKDITDFMIIHLLFLVTFGCAMECLSMNRPDGEELI